VPPTFAEAGRTGSSYRACAHWICAIDVEENTTGAAVLSILSCVCCVSGCVGGRVEDGEHYDPINLPEGLCQDARPVWFVAMLRAGLTSCHTWGCMVALLRIERL
jgi:hypothetical protein